MRALVGLFLLVGFVACKSGNAGHKDTATKQPQTYMTAIIDGEKWQAQSVSMNPLGDMIIIKATDDDGRVLSLNLPKVTGLQTLPIHTGGEVGITWSVSRKEGFTYTTPFKGYDDKGVITITLNEDGLLGGEFYSTISNGGREIAIEKGSFLVK